jgi:hypothetical protein
LNFTIATVHAESWMWNEVEFERFEMKRRRRERYGNVESCEINFSRCSEMELENHEIKLKDYWRCHWVNLVEENRNLPVSAKFSDFFSSIQLKKPHAPLWCD